MPNNSDLLKDSVSAAINQVVTALRPQIEQQIEQAIKRVTHGAMGGLETIENKAERGLQSAEKQPWVLVGLAAALLVSAGFMMRTNHSSDYSLQ